MSSLRTKERFYCLFVCSDGQTTIFNSVFMEKPLTLKKKTFFFFVKCVLIKYMDNYENHMQ